MGTLYLVRHGQASFGADDYDQLSEQGQRQSVRLGEYFAFKGIVFEATLTGTLRRHAQTFAGIKAGMEAAGTPPLPEPSAWPGLNEYDSAAVIATVHPEALQKPSTPELYKHHFRVLRQGLAAWMAGRVQPEGMPTYVAFRDGIAAVLDHVRTRHTGNVLLVSSGGPISTAVGQVLGTAPETTIDLNMRIRNSAVTEFVYTQSRHVLLTYNTLPHLDHPDHAGWITFA
ncbi:histidine phosphatase family protein [Pseudorhodoferax sp. Leaf274]|uniref:histidine phosphatase family protein n=1 Tax=Pseudorhodoferax sp. Leaf274 TaxID=1736318 RepID=UPI00070290DC|nr:histidine phosphatase family protein [Pseudorhodoferax sp. Leaf274]KQP38035.1 phosphoglycerate kinase [Pseudorhodoferax sp. Leaf274]